MKKLILTLGMLIALTATNYGQDVMVNGWQGYGFKFWGASEAFKMVMGNSAYHKYGPVQDFSIKTKMDNTGSRGWVWGVHNVTPVAALNRTGNMQIKGNFAAEGKMGIGYTEANVSTSPYMLNIDAIDHGIFLVARPTQTWQVGMVVDIQNVGNQLWQDTHRAYVVKNGGIEKFYVQGDGTTRINNTLYAKEIFVQSNVWPDYVFKKDYKLKSLSEVERFIEKNNHLPGIPSESEVIEGGINVSEMNVMLLQKIEELTLYSIEQQKMINNLKKKVEKMEDVIK